MDEFLHLGKADCGPLRSQLKDAVGFVRPSDAIRVEVMFPVANMRDALSFFEPGLAATQAIQSILEPDHHEIERLCEEADFIVSPDLGQVSPFPFGDRLRRVREGRQRSKRASARPKSQDQEYGDNGLR